LIENIEISIQGRVLHEGYINFAKVVGPYFLKIFYLNSYVVEKNENCRLNLSGL
jgi:hypothetical protein